MSLSEDQTGPDETGDFVRLKKWVTAGQRRRKYYTVEATRAYQFVANQQWSEEDKRMLDEQHRPSVSFNRTAPLIKAVCGLEVNNRQGVVYLPRVQGNVGVDEARTGAVKWVRDETQAEDEESEAFRDLTITGEGWVETRMDYDDNPMGKIVEERIDPLEMGVDEWACRANYIDARMVYRIRELPVDDAADLVNSPDKQLSPYDLHAAWLEDSTTPADGGTGNKTDYPDKTRETLNRDGVRRTKVRLVQVQWWEREPYHAVAQEGQQDLQMMNPEDFKTYQDRVAQMEQADQQAQTAHADAASAHQAAHESHAMGVAAGVLDPNDPPPAPPPAPVPTAPKYTHVAIKKKCYYQAFLGRDIFDKIKIDMGEFNFKAMTGERDRENHCFYGMLRDMFDPQMWANKWLSQTMHIMNTNAKGGIMAETDAFVNVRKAEQDWADNTKIIWVKPGALSKAPKIKERTPPPLPQGLGELMQFALSSLRDVTGVNLELLGQADREQAASLEAQRRQSAMTILATLFDSLRRFRKAQGRLLLHFVDMLPAGTLIRVTEQGLQKYIPLVKDRKSEEYDVIFDEAPTSPDQKQATWAMTLQLIQGGVPLPPPVIIKLLKYSPYPETVVQEITEAMGLGSTMPPEMMKQKLDQAEQALKVVGDQLTKATAEADTAKQQVAVKAAKAGIDDYRAKTDRMSTLLTAGTAQANLHQTGAIFAIEKLVEAEQPTQGE